MFLNFYFAEKRRKDEPTNAMFSGLNSTSDDDMPTMVTTNQGESSFPSSRHRTSSDLTNIKPKPTIRETPTTTAISKGNGRMSTNQGLMSPFRTFILSEGDSLFDSDPSAWGDLSSFDKAASLGKNLPLSKLTSPGTTGEVLL